jgi:hypothetical protein
MANEARVSQDFVEVAEVEANPATRVTQDFIEATEVEANPATRVSQDFIEASEVEVNPATRTTQDFIEVFYLPAPPNLILDTGVGLFLFEGALIPGAAGGSDTGAIFEKCDPS